LAATKAHRDTSHSRADFHLCYHARTPSPRRPPAYAPRFTILGLVRDIRRQAIRSPFGATTLAPFSRTPRPSMPGRRREYKEESTVATQRQTAPRDHHGATPSTPPTPDHAAVQSPPPIVSHIPVSSLLTLRLQLFSVFVHTTCSLSVFEPYLALRVVYLAICTAFPNYATLQPRRVSHQSHE